MNNIKVVRGTWFEVRSVIYLIFIVFMGCSNLPKETYRAYLPDIDYALENDSIRIRIVNTIKAPVRLNVKSEIEQVQKQLNRYFPKVMDPLDSLHYHEPTDVTVAEFKLRFSFIYGSLEDPIVDKDFELPFETGKAYPIMQGYRGKFSHRTEFSHYAIDFQIPVGGVICAAADGVVVGLINKYREGGPDRKWRDYANLITLYHPDRGLFTQYVHLDFESNLVNLGDTVKAGQPIGRSGETGWTTGAHLHFNVLRSSEESMKSYPIVFQEELEGRKLRKGKRVRKTDLRHAQVQD